MVALDIIPSITSMATRVFSRLQGHLLAPETMIDQARIWTAVVATAGLFLITRILYRLYFHPLAKIPGPKLAAASHLLEFYYDVILGGQYVFRVEKMHQKYGFVSLFLILLVFFFFLPLSPYTTATICLIG